MNLSDPLNIELYHNNLQGFNQTCDETVTALDRELDQDMLDNLHE